MQNGQGQAIPESPRPVHGPFDMALGEHPFIHEASEGCETD